MNCKSVNVTEVPTQGALFLFINYLRGREGEIETDIGREMLSSDSLSKCLPRLGLDCSQSQVPGIQLVEPSRLSPRLSIGGRLVLGIELGVRIWYSDVV